ncbi:MAG: hypothetical protein AVDCRST_MAG90-789 [uncultured Microvirga sp.]|uniref:Ribonuclease VapC n=1 Tax=uncultured Microvirga sp. TaxID=412392 RepID=A0A6J4KWH1_9HYPH|nr:MAG: hypothetical protein AVDCRST_MAG90-789 [uncultured Microvirga sp.]
MIAVDSSALVAVVLTEEEADDYARIIGRHRCLIGWPTIFETSMVLRDRAPGSGAAFLDALLARPNVTTVAFDGDLCGIARSAFDLYGRGSGHPARLNFGDCMAYAVAKRAGVGLLFKGADFLHTDLRPALP